MSNPTPTSPQTFPLFTHLPPELQQQIYLLSLTPRLVLVLPIHNSLKNPTYFSPTPIPPLLHTCRLSRRFLLTHYTLTFSSSHQKPQVYFFPEIDILYFPPGIIRSASQQPGLNGRIETWPVWFNEESTGLVRNLCVELHLGDIYMERDCVKFLLRSMSMFKGLKTVFLAETVNGVAGGEVFDRRYKIRDEDLLGDTLSDPIGYLDCETADIIFRSSQPPGDFLSYQYSRELSIYKHQYHNSGYNFFHDVKQDLIDEVQALAEEQLPGKNIPEIRLVQVMKWSAAQRLMDFRRAYWNMWEERVEKEREFGVWGTDEWEQRFWDDLEVAQEGV